MLLKNCFHVKNKHKRKKLLEIFADMNGEGNHDEKFC